MGLDGQKFNKDKVANNDVSTFIKTTGFTVFVGAEEYLKRYLSIHFIF